MVSVGNSRCGLQPSIRQAWPLHELEQCQKATKSNTIQRRAILTLLELMGAPTDSLSGPDKALGNSFADWENRLARARNLTPYFDMSFTLAVFHLRKSLLNLRA